LDFLSGKKSTELCRICGSTGREKIRIFSSEGRGRNLLEKIDQHLPITVSENDKLPLHICEVCAMQLDVWHQLVRCCQETEVKLQQLISNEEQEESNKVFINNSN